MVQRLLLALLLVLAAGGAGAQSNAPPGMTRHGSWVEGRLAAPGQDGCMAGTAVPGRGLVQAAIGRGTDRSVSLVLAIRIERANFVRGETVRLTVDGRGFELPGQASPSGGPIIVVAASTEEEARTLSDLLVAMRRGRELKIQVGGGTALDLPLTGASPALGAMRTCAQRAGLMPR